MTFVLIKENPNEQSNYMVLSKPLMPDSPVRVWNSNWDAGSVGLFPNRQEAINVASEYGGEPYTYVAGREFVEQGTPVFTLRPSSDAGLEHYLS